MPSDMSVHRGEEVLSRLLQDQCFDVRQLDMDGFRLWIERHLGRWQQNRVFVQRAIIRELRRSHPQLARLQREFRGAAAADAASAEHIRLERIEKELVDAAKAIAGLSREVPQSEPPRRAALEAKRSAFKRRQDALRAERQELLARSPERQALLRARDALRRMRTEIGLDREQAVLEDFQKGHGQHSGRTGSSFESHAARCIESEILPELLSSNGNSPRRAVGDGVHVLRGVTLGAGRVELDALVIRETWEASTPDEVAEAEVLALVEVKRNINDLAHGFRRRQENLAWLTGDELGYEPQAYRTRHFASGHFNRPAMHSHQGRSFAFSRRSFRHFRRDPATNQFLDRVYWITRPGPLWGISSGALSRLSHHIASDIDWAPDDPQYLERLRQWCLSLTHPLEAPDVLEIYRASGEPRVRQVLLAAVPPTSSVQGGHST